MPRISIASLLLLCLLGWSGETYHVAVRHPRADDAGPGSAEQPWRGLSASVAKLKPGDTLLVHGGMYRETVELSVSGTPGRPITIRAVPGERAVVLGSQRLTGWKRCAAGEAEGNPQADKLWVIDLPVLPPRLIGDPLRRQEYRIATMPSEGRWQMESAEGWRRFTDAKNLTGITSDAYDGWRLVITGGIVPRDFTYDPIAHVVNLGYVSRHYEINPARDGYWFENHPRGIDGPGRYAWRWLGETTRLWVWPYALDGDQPLVEEVVHMAPFTTKSSSGPAWLVIDGLELRFAGREGGGRSFLSLHDSEIRNCLWYAINSPAIDLVRSERVAIRRNLIRYCGFGVCVGGSREIRIEHNEIGWCTMSGVYSTSSVRVIGNLIRNNLGNSAICINGRGSVEEIEIRDNAIVNGRYLIHIMDANRGVTVDNNILYGWDVGAINAFNWVARRMRGYNPSKANADDWLKAFAEAPSDHCRFVHNTVVGGEGYPCDLAFKMMSVCDNVIAPLTECVNSGFYALRCVFTRLVDHNLLSTSVEFPRSLGFIGSLVRGPEGDLVFRASNPAAIDELRESHGLEHNGLQAEALFINAPRHIAFGDNLQFAGFTRERLIIEERFRIRFSIGDTIELANDGVARRVTAIEPWGEHHCALTFSPPISQWYDQSVLVANWKDAKDLILDLRLRDGSPGKGAASDGKDLGSSIDLPAYLRGDFDGDGNRDIPADPAEDGPTR